MPTVPSKIDLDFSLAGKVAVITGAGSGIGAAIAAAFAAKGAWVALLDIDRDAAKARASALPSSTAWACDVADAESVAAVVAAVETEIGGIDILVNCAGIVDLAPAEEISLAAWRRTLDINLTGSFLMAQAVGRRMIARRYGRIVNMASQAGSVAIEGHVAYSASKFAIIGMTKTLAIEWGRHGITVNSISPTVVLTASAGSPGRAEGRGDEGADPDRALRRAGGDRRRRTFLASEAAGMINGADLLIDGGFTAK